jgi:hypothetical protein
MKGKGRGLEQPRPFFLPLFTQVPGRCVLGPSSVRRSPKLAPGFGK